MFTGIVKLETQIYKIIQAEHGKRLEIVLPVNIAKDIQIGASVAINGTCLTVVAIQESSDTTLLAFDVIFESLRLTNLDQLKTGDWVNIERAAKFGDEIGGHQLSGHIHTMVEVCQLVKEEGEFSIQFRVPSAWNKYIFHKGYIGLNGCSLTIGEVIDDLFWVHLIPETLAVTNFDKLQTGSLVNLEVDTQTQTVVDTIERMLQANPDLLAVKKG